MSATGPETIAEEQPGVTRRRVLKVSAGVGLLSLPAAVGLLAGCQGIEQQPSSPNKVTRSYDAMAWRRFLHAALDEYGLYGFGQVVSFSEVDGLQSDGSRDLTIYRKADYESTGPNYFSAPQRIRANFFSGTGYQRYYADQNGSPTTESLAWRAVTRIFPVTLGFVATQFGEDALKHITSVGGTSVPDLSPSSVGDGGVPVGVHFLPVPTSRDTLPGSAYASGPTSDRNDVVALVTKITPVHSYLPYV